MIVQANAKINLALHITNKMENGFHQLETIVTFAEFADEINIQKNNEIKMKIIGEQAKNLDGKNIIIKTAEMMKKYTDSNQGAEIILDKKLPVASGMGGGSSNAAATIMALKELWGSNIGQAKIMEIAKKLGADVPMCIIGKPLMAKGIGEKITLIENMPEFAIVAVNPQKKLESKKVFENLKKINNPPLEKIPKTENMGEWIEWLKNCRNDMTDAASKLMPEIKKCLKIIESTEPKITRMTGAGATCFGLYTSIEDAQNAQEKIKMKHPNWWVKSGKTI